MEDYKVVVTLFHKSDFFSSEIFEKKISEVWDIISQL